MSIDRKRRTVRVRITGRVQGVCFRAWTERTASAMGLSGWVCNRRDGAVEALFSGATGQVGEMCMKSCGTSGAYLMLFLPARWARTFCHTMILSSPTPLCRHCRTTPSI